MEEKQTQMSLLEENRKKICKKSNLFYLIAGLFIVLGVVVTIYFIYFGLIFFIVAAILILVISREVNQFKKDFKEKVVKELIKEELGVDAVYQSKGGISLEEVMSLKVASRPDKFFSEDYISCSYHNIPYEMCDYVLQEEVVTRDSHGNTHVSYETYFKGRVIKIDFQRNLNMQLKVVNRPIRGFSKENLIPFETEVIDFNKRFKSYASSKEDGFYILTPMMIQKMIELEQLYAGGMFFVVKNNNFYVLINNSGDSLEVNMRKPLDDTQFKKIKSDILIGASIINEFRMDADKFNVDR